MLILVTILIQQVIAFCIGGGDTFGFQGPYVVDDYDSIV